MRKPLLAEVRSIVVIESILGVLVLLVGLGLLILIHRDAVCVTNLHLWLLASATLVYSLVHGVEAYALRNVRRGTDWLALGSTNVNLPVEIYLLGYRMRWIRIGVFAVNVAVVANAAYALSEQHGEQSRQSAGASSRGWLSHSMERNQVLALPDDPV